MNNILVIENEHNIQKMLSVILSSKGYCPFSAFDGSEGYKLAMNKKFDAIILDYLLPKKTGLEICRNLRKNKIQTPILIITSNIEFEFKIKFLHYGADDFVQKPFVGEELCARLHAIIRRSTNYYSTELYENTIHLNSITQRVTKNDTSILLTKKEYALLEYMMKFKGIILSRAILFEHVWNKNADPFSNTLEAHILSLRKKLGFKRNQFIKCISGRGYMLQGQ